MERMGLVSQVEAELERMIALDRLPADGSLPSEQKLARRYGVSRGTLREALLRLSARGLVVQHPGRKTRAVVLDEAVTLENLSVALHGRDKASPERLRLLEGFFALKRDVTVELLAACCEKASQAELDRLEEACFALREAARWSEEGRGWAQQEFALLRLAARVADRPGHLLLLHSLERSFWAMAEWVLPRLNPEAVQGWAQCVLYALGEKNAQGLRRELPPLLQACEAQLLSSLGHANYSPDTDEAHPATPVPSHADRASAPEASSQELSDAAAANLSGCRTGSLPAPPTGAPQSEPPATDCHEPARVAYQADSPPGQEEDRGSPHASAAASWSSHSASALGQYLPGGPPRGSERAVGGPAPAARRSPFQASTAPDNTG